MVDEIIITNNDAPVDEPVGNEDTRWESIQLEQARTNQLLNETVTELRNVQTQQTQLVTNLLETNQQLTRQLQETPTQVMQLITPLLTPPASPIVVEETPPSDVLATGRLESDPVVELPPEPVAEKRQQKFRRL